MGTTDLVLAALVAAPRHGYEIKRIHDEWFPLANPLAYGQVYSALGRLTKDGCVEVAEVRADGGPERTVYALTPRGRERVERWLAEPVAPMSPGAGELVRKTVAALRISADPLPMLLAQRTAYLRRMRELSDQQPTDPLAALSRDHALEHLDADLRWLERAADRLARPDPVPEAGPPPRPDLSPRQNPGLPGSGRTPDALHAKTPEEDQ
ncbi:MAG: PadR family transcriptional regulator [Actinomycetales bacterium]|nr:PadR family transcriptional regulator [Actinomycetales bacterium]